MSCRFKNFIFYFFPISSICIRTNFDSKNLYIENKINIYYKKIFILNLKIHLLKKKKIYSIINILNYSFKIQSFSELLIYGTNQKNKHNLQINTDIKNGILNRLTGKKGRIRNTILSKRVDFSSRAVISPDPKSMINILNISFFSFKKLSYPLKITKYNSKSILHKFFNLKKNCFLIKYITNIGKRKKFSSQFIRNKLLKKELKNNFIIEREVLEHDIVIFNRQPSLHRFSIFSLLLKPQNSKTFSFNSIICSPFNADFDGDEMNIHLLQDIESKIEALEIMSPFVNFNLINNFQLLFSPIQDQIYIYYLKSNKKTSFNYPINMYKNNNSITHLKQFNKLKFIFTNKPKQILYNSLKNNIHNNFFANKLNIFNKNENTEILYNYCSIGILSKKKFTNKNIGLAELITKFEGKYIYQKLMSEINHTTTNYSTIFSNTLGINHMLYQQNTINVISKFNTKIITFFKNIMSFYSKNITLQFKNKMKYCILKQLINFYQKFQKLLFNLSFSNSIYIDNLRLINNSGSKGTKTNILSIKIHVGFQSLIFKTYSCSFLNIIFPFHIYNSQSINYNNIVADSFTKGLDTANFFAHVSAGREAVIESSIKASETGYLARKLQISICDVFLHYDFSIRNSIGIYLNSMIYKKFNKECIGTLNIENHSYYRYLTKKCLDYLVENCNFNNPCKLFNESLITTDIYPCFSFNITHWGFFKHFFISISHFFEFNFCIYILYNYLCVDNFFKISKTNKLIIYPANYINDYYFYSIFKLFIFRKLKNLETPGIPLGLRSAQSLTEPCTQMTLKTFHFTGSMINNIHKAFVKIRSLLNITINSRNNSYFVTLNNNKIYSLQYSLMKFKKNLNNTKDVINISTLDIYFNNCNI
mmetsp:Transcript_19440/g.36604  ORF Transcript_19440/g.36604 Transcript_19440/m.36604 type:complete len:876 (+) Transcript_19440:206-2833(+)